MVASCNHTASPPCAPCVSPRFTPTDYVARLTELALPLVDDEGNGAGEAELAAALAPEIGHYTVADAVYMLGLLRVAIGSTPGTDAEGKDCRKFGAMCSVAHLLEDYAAGALGSGPACASARAFLLARSTEDGEWMLRDNAVAAKRVLDDINDTRSGCTSGETFDGTDYRGVRYDPPSWLMHLLEDTRKGGAA